MNLKLRKIFMMMVVVALIVAATTATALADDTITTGEGDASATVPVEGTISALTVSVTHPATIAYSIDPNTGDTYGIIAPEITLVNNTLVPVRVTVESMFSTPGGTLQFADVLPTDRDWANLSVADSKEFIAIGLEIPPNAMEWNVGYNTGTYYAADMTMVEFGTLNYGCMGVLTLVANHGLAFDQAYTSMHSLFFMFDLV
jgi:hypothetical protein